MLTDAVVARLEKALRDGVKPAPVEFQSKPRVAPEVPVKPSGADWMASVVPGVTPQGAQAPRSPATRAPALRPAPAPAPAPEVGAPIAELRAERDALRLERDALLQDLEVLRERLQRAEDGREQAESVAETLRAEGQGAGVPVMELLKQRGLLGLDEGERALHALAGLRALRDLLPSVRVGDPGAFSEALARRVVLVGGEAPEGLPTGVAPIAVAEERAELPDRAALAKALARMGEALLLNGWRRVLLLGGDALSHRLLAAGLDRRVEWRSVPVPPGARARTGADAEADQVDLIVLWGVVAAPEAMAAWAKARRALVQLPSGRLGALLDALHGACTEGA
jgi:hypothetical protein